MRICLRMVDLPDSPVPNNSNLMVESNTLPLRFSSFSICLFRFLHSLSILYLFKQSIVCSLRVKQKKNAEVRVEDEADDADNEEDGRVELDCCTICLDSESLGRERVTRRLKLKQFKHVIIFFFSCSTCLIFSY